MRDPSSNQEKVVTAVYLLAGLLLVVTLFASCTSTGHTTQYGNQSNHCEAYQ